MARLGRGMPARSPIVRPPADITAPTVPPNLRVVFVSQTAITVEWDPSADDYGLAGYGVWLDGVQQGGDQPGTSATLSGLTPDTDYLVEVDAVDRSGNRSARAAVPVRTLVLDSTPPSTPGGLTVTAVGPYTATLSWEPASDNLGVIGYGVYVDGAHVADTPGLSYAVAL